MKRIHRSIGWRIKISTLHEAVTGKSEGKNMVCATAQQIGVVMGLLPLPNSLAQLDEIVCQGLSPESLAATVARIYPNDADQQTLLRQFGFEARRFNRHGRLSTLDSELTERLARVVALSLHVWDCEESARLFLTQPHPLLNGCAPVAIARTEIGARRIEQLLLDIFNGMPV